MIIEDYKARFNKLRVDIDSINHDTHNTRILVSPLFANILVFLDEIKIIDPTDAVNLASTSLEIGCLRVNSEIKVYVRLDLETDFIIFAQQEISTKSIRKI